MHLFLAACKAVCKIGNVQALTTTVLSSGSQDIECKLCGMAAIA